MMSKISPELLAKLSDRGGQRTYARGELSLDGGLRTASVQATHGSICVVVPQAEVQAFLGDYPEFAEALVMSLIARVRRATLQAKRLGQGD
jgi:CRP/FNR family cyclic AMP-dependent transcriptional regulator